jgi:hypothetical protein
VAEPLPGIKFCPTGGVEPTIRVALYASAKPVSSMHATPLAIVPGAATYPVIGDALAHPGLEAVLVAAPTSLHPPIVEAALSALPHVRPLKTDELYRLDAASRLDVTLPASTIDDLRSGLRPYVRLFATLYPARRYLRGWADRFLAKFPADRDVSLMDVYRAVTEQGDTYRPAAFPDPPAGSSSSPPT